MYSIPGNPLICLLMRNNVVVERIDLSVVSFVVLHCYVVTFLLYHLLLMSFFQRSGQALENEVEFHFISVQLFIFVVYCTQCVLCILLFSIGTQHFQGKSKTESWLKNQTVRVIPVLEVTGHTFRRCSSTAVFSLKGWVGVFL